MKRPNAMSPRLLLVHNPHCVARSGSPLWEAAVSALHARASACASVGTQGDGGDAERIAGAIAASAPEVVVAAGGDGTASDVVHAVLASAASPKPDVALFPLGTGNNAARSLGMRSCHSADPTAFDLAVEAALAGRSRPTDVGRLGQRHFIGSAAVGMDADILHLRNRLRSRLAGESRIGGYPLYLASCGLNLFRSHGGSARLTVDGTESRARVYNLLIANTALYAGEFRFDAAESSDDGCLDVLVFRGAIDYVAGFVSAWRRHLRHGRGRPVRPDRRLRRVRQLTVQLEAPLACQLDGEEIEPRAELAFDVLPGAVRVRVPRS